MKALALCALCAAVSQIAFAQDAANPLVAELIKHWDASKSLSLAVAEAMPENAYSFKATEAERSFGGQMNHLALANAHYCSAAIGTDSPLGKPADDTKATVVKNVTAAYDYCLAGLKGMTDADLQKTATVRGNTVSKFELFLGGFTHAAHTRGQAEVYLRLKGVTPPDYKF